MRCFTDLRAVSLCARIRFRMCAVGYSRKCSARRPVRFRLVSRGLGLSKTRFESEGEKSLGAMVRDGLPHGDKPCGFLFLFDLLITIIDYQQLNMRHYTSLNPRRF